MQVVRQRAQYAAKQAAKKALKRKSLKDYDETWSRNQERSRAMKRQNALLRDARNHRREDWELGSLAPRRDVGEEKEKYGSLHMFDYALPSIPNGKGPETWHISEGDRVVVVRGRERGKIGVVVRKEDERCSLMVKGINMVDMQVPGWLRSSQGNDGAATVQESEGPISIGDVRLVYPLPDPKTGVPRDVIIEKLVRVDNPEYDDVPYWQRDPDEPVRDPIRAIPGTNIIIPRPEPAPKDPEENNEADTKLMQVEEPTFRAFLLHPPMPISVIDELRNKYSKFRTRHTWEYIEKKESEDAKEKSREGLIKNMQTPLQQLAEVRQERSAERDLTENQLAKIGELIAKERSKQLPVSVIE